MQTPKNVKALEEALPSLVSKLKELTRNLTDEEKVVFSEIIESAAIHTKLVQAHEEGPEEIAFAKPKSKHSTARMKAEYVKLPKKLGITLKE